MVLKKYYPKVIDKLDISEFRGIKKCDSEIEFSKFNVLVGRNNSGKTAILESIYLMLNDFGNDPYLGNIERRLAVQARHSGHESLVYGYSGTAVISLWLKDGCLKLVLEDGGRFSHQLTVDQKTYTELNAQTLSDFLDINPQNIPRSILYVPVNVDSEVIREVMQNDSKAVTKAGAHKTIISLINKCISDDFTEVIMETLKVRKELPKTILYIDLRDLGHGLTKVIPPLIMIETFKPKLVLWDDFEISAHPSLISSIITWLNEKDSQIIMSTHSIDVLSELIAVDPDDAAIIQLSKTSEDVLCHKKLNLDELEIIMEQGAHDPRLLSEALQL